MIVGSICMRGGSKGVKGKNYRDLLGKPLLSYTINCAKSSKLLEDVIISSDSDLILDLSSNYLEKEKLFKRNSELATDNASKWEVFQSLVLEYEEKNKVKITHLVDLDVTVPRRLPEHIDSCIKLSKETDADVIITGYEPERNPYFNMMEENKDGTAVIVKKSEIPIKNRQESPIVYSLTPAVYVIKREALFNYEHWSNATCRIFPIPRNLAIDIDTELDFKLVEFLMNEDGK
ncbi:acylneuraminate cytidylyltransferase family protein [Polaribacter sp. PL03]|uniref:acylneuraminate cytidylyltransferase family protein n=1 Tax=Polaribacter sp. PL03 TaxID=3088353 RepID=UPI0029CC2563|nr:acylneuraminate cytidylyltransferase family protein [Polaribacter sp. PL03]MDX6746062.1 acylneuraminate cytidylyltransferase family protein [Polaribacter sp. PL03]